MLQLMPGTEQLVRGVTAHIGRESDDLIRAAFECEAKALGIADADEQSVRYR